MSEKNILIVYWGKDGGLPKFAYEVADGLIRAGYNVYAVLSEDICNKDIWDSNPDIRKAVYIYTGNTKKFAAASFKMLTSTKHKIKKELKNIDFYASICIMPYLWCRYISKILHVKHKMIIAHDPVPHSSTNKLRAAMVKKATKGYDHAIIMTESFRQIMKDLYKYKDEQICYMRHGLYSYGNPIEADNTNDGKINFLFFGNINKYKGIPVLLDAYKKAYSESGNMTLRIAGRGNTSEWNKTMSELHDFTLINRFVADEEVPVLFSKPNTVTVLPYIDATQSGVIPVAMEYLSPIIASDTGGLKEQLFNGELGSFFKTGDSDELSELLVKYATSPELIESEKATIKEYVRRLDWKNIVTELIENL